MITDKHESKVISEILLENYKLKVENEKLKQMYTDGQETMQILTKEFFNKKQDDELTIENLETELNKLKQDNFNNKKIKKLCNRINPTDKTNCISFSFNKQEARNG